MREGYMENESTFGFYFNDNEGKTVDIQITTSDGALGVVEEFEKFLKACGYISDGHLTIQRPSPTKLESVKVEQKRKDFDFSAIPNNNWPFGELKAEPLPAITSIDLSSLTVTDLTTMETKSWSNWATPKVNQYPTMAPLTTEQIQSWTTDMPGTLGYPKVKF
jgi:hypothetical protein